MLMFGATICSRMIRIFLATLFLPFLPDASGLSLAKSGPIAPSLNQLELDDAMFPRSWVPLASVFELDESRPISLSFLGMSYVAFFDGSARRWSVLDDSCPHRLAPLSEGRIDPKHPATLECSYHGWEFDKDGICQTIPQIDQSASDLARKNPKCHVQSYPVYVEKHILFFWPWKEDVLSCSPVFSPEKAMAEALPGCATYTRDLPYGWDILLENIVDPSHVPFAHHGLQGERADAIPINMTFPTDVSEAGFSFEFGDRTMSMRRQGSGVFKAPFMIVYEGQFEKESGNNKSVPTFNLTAIMTPTKPGWSRMILLGPQLNPSKERRREESMAAKIFRKLPQWLIHMLNNRFLDSDLFFLHSQNYERVRRDPENADPLKPYFMPAQSDRSVSAMRTWIKKYAHIPSPLPVREMNRDVLFDRSTQHLAHCVHCSRAFEVVKKLKTLSRRAAYASTLLSKFTAARIAIVLCLVSWNRLAAIERAFIEGGFSHYDNH